MNIKTIIDAFVGQPASIEYKGGIDSFGDPYDYFCKYGPLSCTNGVYSIGEVAFTLGTNGGPVLPICEEQAKTFVKYVEVSGPDEHIPQLNVVLSSSWDT